MKIDRSFVTRADERTHERAVIRGVAPMGRSLGLRTVAEGAETAAHVDILRACGCDEVQGYHLARPMPAPDLTVLLGDEGRTDAHVPQWACEHHGGGPAALARRAPRLGSRTSSPTAGSGPRA